MEIRVNNLGNRPVLLRMGSGEYHTKLAEYLMGLLTATSSEHDQEEFELDKQRYKKLEEKFIQLNDEENELIRLRNETDELDQAVEKIRTDVLPEIFEKLKNINQQQFQNALDALKKAIKRSNKDTQSFLVSLFWNFVKKERYEKLQAEIENFKPFASRIGIDLPTLNQKNPETENLKHVSENLDRFLYFIQTVQEYFSSLKTLQKAKPLEKISMEKIALMKNMAANAENLWKGWLRLQPTRLSSEDRNLLSNYNALLKMVIDAGSDLYTKLGKKNISRIFKSFKNKCLIYYLLGLLHRCLHVEESLSKQVILTLLFLMRRANVI